MKKYYIAFLFMIWVCTHTYAQIVNDYYVSVSMDEDLPNCRLKFINESSVELSNISPQADKQIKHIFAYTTHFKTIVISPSSLPTQDSLAMARAGLTYFITPTANLTKIDGGFIDYSKSLIYVHEKDFSTTPNLTYIIDGKSYVQEMGVVDGHGVAGKRPKTNKVLQGKLKTINENPEKWNVEIVKGLDAYKRFGIKMVFGVIVITSR